MARKLSKDGKRLEALVAFVEKTLVPQGAEVKINDRVFNDDGVQIAEFDIEVRGKVGTGEIIWLIECRDRPSEGAAPVSWIEQLVGRRKRFGFNKVTAVSTTGFAAGAKEFAEKSGIELREVKSLTPECFADWCAMSDMSMFTRVHQLHHVKIIVDEKLPAEVHEELRTMLKALNTDSPVLLSSKDGSAATPGGAFIYAVSTQPELFADVLPNQAGKEVKMRVMYSNDTDHFVVKTSHGPVRVKEILFHGELILKESKVPLEASEYAFSSTGKIISQTAAFRFQTDDTKLSFEMHKIPDSGFIHVVVRNVPHKKPKAKSRNPRRPKTKGKVAKRQKRSSQIQKPRRSK